MSDELVREKPYDFVPISNTPKNQQAAGHHILGGVSQSGEPERISGSITGTIESLALVAVASGYIVPVAEVLRYSDLKTASDQSDKLIAAHFRSQNRRMLPGSSLKGTIRSIVEAITAPGVNFRPEKREKTVRRVRVTSITNKVTNQRLAPPPGPPDISLANRLFGITSDRYGYQGHCTFYDAPQVRGGGVLFRRLPLYRPQPDYSEGDPTITTNWWRYFRDEGQQSFRGRKFYRSGVSQEVRLPYTAVEACEIGSCFTFSMRFDNLSTAELGVLLIALGADGKLPQMKVGGGKPLSFGTVRFTELRVTTTSLASYSDFESHEEDVVIDDCLAAAYRTDEIVQVALDKLADIVTRPATFTAGGAERLY